jgi:4,5-dihydroxyphthalate decarboxylase
MKARFDVMLGNYPHTEALKSGAVSSDHVALNVAPITVAPSAFRDVVALRYDLAELSIPTFLIARSKSVPLVLLPADLFKRVKPPELIYEASRGLVRPADLQGKRIGVAYYTATTTIWMQCLLGNAGLDLRTVRWVALEGPHVADFQDPPHVERVVGKTLVELLRDGDADAIVTANPPPEPNFRAMEFDAPDHRRSLPYPLMQSHHLIVAKSDLTQRHPEAIREIWRMLLQSRALALGRGNTECPYGLSANRVHLDLVIDACFTLKLIEKRPAVEELFDPMVASLPSSV